MLQTFKNAWKIPEIRKKILFVLLMILVYRIGCAIPVPFVDASQIEVGSSSFFGLFNLLTGGAFEQYAVFALGITPNINASIIIQLLTMVIPSLERLSKEGEEGRQKIAQITKYVTLGISLLMAIGFTLGFGNILVNNNFFTYLFVIVTLTAGSMLLMWIGDLMTEKGIGNGISMLIFISIVARIVPSARTLISNVSLGMPWWLIPLIAIGAVLLFAAIVFMDRAERKVSVNYAKKVVGRKMYGGQSTHIPMKLNPSGVLPVIFAMSITTLPQMIAQWFPNGGFATFIMNWFSQGAITWYGKLIYIVVYGALIVFFAYFYTTMSFNPPEVAKNLKENGGFVLGIRPGKPTSDYLSRILNRITLVGSLFLTLVAILPILLGIFSPYLTNMALGGTSVIILVNVALETTNQLESQMLMRHYKGFLKG